MFSVCYILTQRMSALETFNDSVLYKCSLNNNNNNNNNNNEKNFKIERLSQTDAPNMIDVLVKVFLMQQHSGNTF